MPGVIAKRFVAQMLTGPPAQDPVDAVARLLAVQAQDFRGARLAIRARTAGLTAADVDRALSDERSLIVTWLNRGTLHLVRSEDYRWLHPLTTPPLFTANARRLAQEGVPPGAAERGVAAVERSLAEGPMTRAQLRERIAAAGVRTEGQALVHVLMLACLRGIAVRGPVRGGEQAYARTRDWLGAPAAPYDRDTALAELARRYLAGHGPATDRDLARWAGLALRDSRRALAAIAAEIDQREDGLAELKPEHGLKREYGLAELRPTDGRTQGTPALPPPRLLGAYEPVLLGWISRKAILGSHEAKVVSGGLFRPFALAGGRAVATWTIANGRITIKPFAPVPAADTAALEADAADVRRFLGAGDPDT